MKTPLTLAALIVALLLIVGTNYYLIVQAVSCETPEVLARTNGATWPQGATITVIIDSNDFPTEEEREAVRAAFAAWERANPNAVQFSFTLGTQQAPPGTINTFYVQRATTTTGAETHIAFQGNLSSPGNRTTSAVTEIDPRMTRASAITSVLMHEIGHTFGLDDCQGCTDGSTFHECLQNRLLLPK